MHLTAPEIATLSRLLDEALELDAAQREAWVNNLPSAEQHLGPKLRELLSERDNTGASGFLAALPALDPTPDHDDATARAGELVGPYRLVREIGRGGMGTVWLAERADGAFKRQVALKLPRLAWGAGLAKRMARERDIGAMLEHPNIARLYDAGVDEHGRPFIALEYIDGVAIDAWCQQRKLPLRDRLRLVVEVAKAVAYAHGRLVVHRDLKPSNVLVSAGGQVHLLDFGIAKLLDDATQEHLATLEQARVLTPHYASPEQLKGETLTVQSDVYSLGVLAYELLTGQLPYDAKRKTPAAIEEAILQGEVIAPSQRVEDSALARQLKGDIDAIVGKATKIEQSQRYATADALAADIERYLGGETIGAQPDSRGYRLRKAVVRHRLPIIAASVVLVVAMVGAGTTLMQSRKAAWETERVRLATAFVSELFLINVSQPKQLRDAPPRAGPAVFVDRAAQLIQARFSSQPDMQAELFGVVAQVYTDLGARRLASEYAGRQLQTLRALNADAQQIARSLILMAEVSLEDRRDTDAEQYAQQAIDMLPRNDKLLPDALIFLALSKLRTGKSDQVEKIVDEIRRVSNVSGEESASVTGWRLLLEGDLAEIRNQFDESKRLWLAAAATALTAEGPASRSLVDLQLYLARRVAHWRLAGEARRLGNAAFAALEGLGEVGSIRAAQAKAHLQTHLFRAELAGFDETMAVLDEVASYLRGQPFALPPYSIATVDFARAEALLKWGEFARAGPLLDASVPLLQQSTRSLWIDFDIATRRASLAYYTGNHEAADRFLRESMDVVTRLYGATSHFMAYHWAGVAFNLSVQGKHHEAAAFLANAPAFQVEGGKKAHRTDPTRVIRLALARVRFDAGDVQGAQRALPSTAPPDEDRAGLESFFELRGEIRCATGEPRAGLGDLMKSLGSLGSRTGPNHPELARKRAVAGLCAISLGPREQAQQLATEARRALVAQPGVSPWFKAPLLELEAKLAKR